MDAPGAAVGSAPVADARLLSDTVAEPLPMTHPTPNAAWQSILLATALCGAGALAAQEEVDARRVGEPRPSRTTMPAPKASREPGVTPRRSGSAREETGAKTGSNGTDWGMPVEVGPHGRCRFEVSVAPDRLMPGQTGTARIVMVLEDDSVLQSADELQVVVPEPPAEGTCHLTLGPAKVHPPKAATVATAYRGRAAYDEWVLVELPVTMSSHAPMGSTQSAAVEVRFRLHEGSTGRRFGEYQSPLSIVCEVGVSPNPAAAAVQPSPVSEGVPATGRALRPAPHPGTSAEPAGTGLAAATPSPGTLEEPRTPDEEQGWLSTSEGAGDLPLLVFSGGLCALGVALWLLRRSR